MRVFFCGHLKRNALARLRLHIESNRYKKFFYKNFLPYTAEPQYAQFFFEELPIKNAVWKIGINMRRFVR